MQNPIRRSIVVIALLALSTPLAACSGSAVKPGPTVTVIKTGPTKVVTKTVPPPIPTQRKQPATSTTPKQNTALKQALAYLRSPQRTARFDRILTKAGIKIAQALQTGKYGPVDRYNGNKEPLTSDYVGWGGIQVRGDKSVADAFAIVYWNHGSIDYSKPITQTGLSSPVRGNRNGADFFCPSTEFIAGDDNTYCQIFLDIDSKHTWITDTHYIGEQTADMRYQGDIWTASLSSIRRLDAAALRQFESNMVSQFGPTWNK